MSEILAPKKQHMLLYNFLAHMHPEPPLIAYYTPIMRSEWLQTYRIIHHELNHEGIEMFNKSLPRRSHNKLISPFSSDSVLRCLRPFVPQNQRLLFWYKGDFSSSSSSIGSDLAKPITLLRPYNSPLSPPPAWIPRFNTGYFRSSIERFLLSLAPRTSFPSFSLTSLSQLPDLFSQFSLI